MSTPTAPRFGALLKTYRTAAGLTQEALAERAGLSARGLQDLERGVHQTPRRDTVEMLATALGLAASARAALLAAIKAPAPPPPFKGRYFMRLPLMEAAQPRSSARDG